MTTSRAHDLWASVRGNEHVLRAIEVSLVADHSIMFIAPPGYGKSLFRAIMTGSSGARHTELTPCLCGYYQDLTQVCTCVPQQIGHWQAKLRKIAPAFDITAYPSRPKFEELFDTRREAFTTMWERVVVARDRHIPKGIEDGSSVGLLKAAYTKLNLSPGAAMRILRVSHSIACLDSACSQIGAAHIAEAIQYRYRDDY